jgi:hypothetical protein
VTSISVHFPILSNSIALISFKKFPQSQKGSDIDSSPNSAFIASGAIFAASFFFRTSSIVFNPQFIKSDSPSSCVKVDFITSPSALEIYFLSVSLFITASSCVVLTSKSKSLAHNLIMSHHDNSCIICMKLSNPSQISPVNNVLNSSRNTFGLRASLVYLLFTLAAARSPEAFVTSQFISVFLTDCTPNN